SALAPAAGAGARVRLSPSTWACGSADAVAAAGAAAGDAVSSVPSTLAGGATAPVAGVAGAVLFATDDVFEVPLFAVPLFDVPFPAATPAVVAQSLTQKTLCFTSEPCEPSACTVRRTC